MNDRKEMLESLLKDYIKDLQKELNFLEQFSNTKYYKNCMIQNEKIYNLHQIIDTILLELRKLSK